MEVRPTYLTNRAAEYVLSVGGRVRLSGENRDLTAAADLPQDRFTLAAVNLDGKNAADAGLAAFQGCTKLTNLYLNNTQVTDAGLAYFRGCTGLTSLSLGNTQVTDAGLATFQNCTGLKELILYGTGLTDAGLAAFQRCKELTVLKVQKTKVTAKGVAEFHAAVPGCRIEYDGGTVEPKR